MALADGDPPPASDGVVVVDKPAGMTSHDVVARVRRSLGGRRRRGRGAKVGHVGTLDPDATGVLVVCVGRATRLASYLQTSRKTYEARLQLGVTTTTLDASGEVVARADASEVDEDALRDALGRFRGEIDQIPPMVSAVRVGGERLHAKARRGEEVERAPRPVTVYDIVLEGFSPGPRASADVRVVCSPGTYIRTLAADVGDRLGVGGHLGRLRRLRSGSFTVEDAVAVEQVEDLASQGRLGEILLPMREAVADYPSVTVGPGDGAKLVNGQPLAATGQEGPVAVVTGDGTLVAMVADRDGAARPLAVLASREDLR